MNSKELLKQCIEFCDEKQQQSSKENTNDNQNSKDWAAMSLILQMVYNGMS